MVTTCVLVLARCHTQGPFVWNQNLVTKLGGAFQVELKLKSSSTIKRWVPRNALLHPHLIYILNFHQWQGALGNAITNGFATKQFLRQLFNLIENSNFLCWTAHSEQGKLNGRLFISLG